MPETQAAPRIEALDVLRGLAILGMALSSLVPYRTLPAWMYHAQLPPPSREPNPNIYGLTWVDVVFPMFLFALGAAIPLALSRRIAKGDSNRKLLGALAERGLLLAMYALVGQHLRPYVLADTPGTTAWLGGLLGFVLVGVLLFRWTESVPAKWRRLATAIAAIIAAITICCWNYPDGTRGFANYRNDVILMVLANVAVSGGAIWLFTRERPWIRWVIGAVLAGIFVTQDSAPISHAIWNFDPTNYLPIKSGPYGRFLPIFYHLEYHKYLLIVLPGTVAGDMVRSALMGSATIGWKPPERLQFTAMWLTYVGVAVACIGLVDTSVPGLIAVLAAMVAAWLTRPPRKPRHGPARSPENEARRPMVLIAHRLFVLAVPLLIVGFLLGPIRKDPTTLAYLVVTPGICAAILGVLTIAGGWLAESGGWRVVRDTGVNPIFGYLVLTNLVPSVCGLTRLDDAMQSLTQNPWLLTLWALIKTVGIALITAWFTRRKLFLRA